MSTKDKILYVVRTPVMIPYYIVKTFVKGFKTLSLFLSRGLYFYLEKMFSVFFEFTNFSLFKNISNYYKKNQENPSHIVLIIVWFLVILNLFDSFYVDNNSLITNINFDDYEETIEETVDEEKEENLSFSKELNLFRMYNKYKLSDINIQKLRTTNAETVAWIIIEGTQINYPIVQTDNNDYYLTHSYDYSYSHNGWVFMDYRNDSLLNDKNTIIYGHNLINGTALGSIKNIFNIDATNIHIFLITSNQKMYTYQIFSAYEIEPEVYYLQTSFYNNESYDSFLQTIKERNTIQVDNNVNREDQIITLSTCTDDNKGRKVIHAKLIKEDYL